MNRSLVQRLPFFYGWVIVGCAMSSNVVRQAAAVATLSIFIVPMTDEFGWSRTGLSGAVSLGGVLGAFVAPFIGPLFDRHGSRAMLVVSAVTVSGCCVALAGTQGLLWFYVAFGISRLMFSTPIEIGTTSAVTKWFVRRRARAMSLLVMSTGAGLTIVPLVVAAAIDIAGWHAGDSDRCRWTNPFLPGYVLNRDHQVWGDPMPALDITDCINESCPWSGKPVQADSLTRYDGVVVGFCNTGCRDKFESAIRHFETAKASRGSGPS